MKVCVTTCPVSDADRLAEALVQARLAACVNILGSIRSRYWWEGTIQSDQEAMLIMKTRDDMVEPLMRHLEDLHPYEVPEFVVLPVEAGLPAYLHWVATETNPGGHHEAP